MKLADLEPRWFNVPGLGTNRDGVSFRCPCRKCGGREDAQRLAVQFANPLDGQPKPLMSQKEKLRHVHRLRTFDVPPGFLWHRTGDTFETLSLSPSVDASASGHWHGFVVNGETKGG